MVMITPPQNIPADLLAGYQAALQEALADGSVKKRYPWHILFKKQGASIFQNVYYISSEMDFENATLWQGIVRFYFKLAAYAFAIQPEGASQTPPAWGPRTRGWWYNAAIPSGLWYYDYFIKKSCEKIYSENQVVWAAEVRPHDAVVSSKSPDVNIYRGVPYFGRRFADDTRWYCIYPPVNNYNHFVFYAAGFYSEGGWKPYCILDVYEITGPWVYNTITWGNKPAAGKLLCSAHMVRKAGWVWGYLYLKGNPSQYGVYLVVREPLGAYFYPFTWWQGNDDVANMWYI